MFSVDLTELLRINDLICLTLLPNWVNHHLVFRNKVSIISWCKCSTSWTPQREIYYLMVTWWRCQWCFKMTTMMIKKCATLKVKKDSSFFAYYTYKKNMRQFLFLVNFKRVKKIKIPFLKVILMQIYIDISYAKKKTSNWRWKFLISWKAKL